MEKPKRTSPKLFGPEFVTHSLTVRGEVVHPLELSLDELRSMTLTAVRDLTRVRGNDGSITSCRGVLLTDILKRADVVMSEHESPGHLYVTLTSSDGHWTLLSYRELFYTAIGDQALVVLEKNGEPLDDKEGRLVFLSAGDDRAPRLLRYLRRVEVHQHYPAQEAQP